MCFRSLLLEMADASIMNVEWETTWSYRGAASDGVNHAVVFQTLAMGSLFLVWLAVSWISVYPKSYTETKKLSVILKEGCKAASFQERILGQYKDWLRPRVIVTRTYAAIFITFCIAQLLIFNMIANYVRGVNASMSLVLTLFAFLLMFMRVTFKHQKIEENDKLGNYNYPLTSFIIFCMILGTWFLLGSYSDIFNTKKNDGSDIMFAVGGGLIAFGMVGMFVSPFLVTSNKWKAIKRGEKSEQNALSLTLSGEFYTSFNLVDCFLVATCLFVFVVLNVTFISRATTKAYAVAFFALYPIPIYGFISNIMHAMQSRSSMGPHLFNMFLFVVFTLCVCLTQLHVCGIPGVSSGCASHLAHDSTTTNWALCFPILLFLLMISMGIIQAPYAPSLLVSQECIEKSEDFEDEP